MALKKPYFKFDSIKERKETNKNGKKKKKNSKNMGLSSDITTH